MVEQRPTCNPTDVYTVKRTCAILGVSFTTLQRYRKRGLIFPTNDYIKRLKYSGQAILDCWDKCAVL